MTPAAGVLAQASGEHPHPLPPLQTEGRNLEDLRWLFKEKVNPLEHNPERTSTQRTSADTPRWLPQLFVVYNNTVRNPFLWILFHRGLTTCEADADLCGGQPSQHLVWLRRRAEWDSRTLVLSSKRPLGVSSMRLGGRNGYSAGNSIRQ